LTMPYRWNKSSVVFIIIISLILMTTSPLIQGFTSNVSHSYAMNESSYETYDVYIRKPYDPSDLSAFRHYEKKEQFFVDSFVKENTKAEVLDNGRDGPMDSPWPMYGHDVVHTGRSSYSTENNPGAEIWRVRGDRAGAVWGSAIMDNDGIIYFGTKGSDSSLYAMYLNGTRKWRYPADGLIWGTPAVTENGDIYCTTWGGLGYLQAIATNGTERWRFYQESSSSSSPTIGEDGTIYFGTDGRIIFAVNPDGTEKWRYITGHIVMGSPTIGHDGTIYIGSSDNYLYALYPNGTLRWRYKTGSYIKGSASIAPDGTIYVPSFDGYLYALYPNGTMKWRVSTGGSIAAAGVALAEDGTIYIGTEQLRVYYPNGTLKWTANVQGSIYGTVPAVSADGTIYVSAGGSLVAVNPDGTEKWRKTLSNEQIRSSPSIGENDRIYVGSSYRDYGYLHAFGLGPLRADAGGPYQGTALRPITLTGLAFGGLPPYQYHWDLGDGNTSTELNPTHTYAAAGNYTATFTITDSEGNISMDTTTVTMDYPFPVLIITRPTNACYIADKQLFPFSFPFILGKITITANVTNHYPITEVQFIIHGKNQYTDTTPPYEWTWTQRNFRLKDNIYVIAYDTKGRYAEQKMDVIKWF
jgi:outer membrane protein assembly factor BamB